RIGPCLGVALATGSGAAAGGGAGNRCGGRFRRLGLPVFLSWLQATVESALHLYYTDHFELPLPAGHRFPMSKYRRLRQAVVADAAHQGDLLLVPPAASDEQLATSHDWNYIRRVAAGGLTAAEIRRIGFPWSPQMVERSRRSSGATIAASRA